MPYKPYLLKNHPGLEREISERGESVDNSLEKIVSTPPNWVRNAYLDEMTIVYKTSRVLEGNTVGVIVAIGSEYESGHVLYAIGLPRNAQNPSIIRSTDRGGKPIIGLYSYSLEALSR